MADRKVIDYYSVLNLPSSANLSGVESAYARLSDELAGNGEADAAASLALQQLNEAYGVLSRPELRRQYDALFFAGDREDEARRLSHWLRRQALMQWSVIGALVSIVVFQAGFVIYLARDQVGGLVSTIAGPLGG